MMTTDQIVEAIKRLPHGELKQLKDRLGQLLEEKGSTPVKRGERIRALAGRFDLGECLQPDWDREMLYED